MHHRVTFQPEGRSVVVLDGTALVEAAGRAGIILNQPCGGEGSCGKCRVELLRHAPEPCPADRRHLTAEELDSGWRLACRLAVHDDLVVSVPERARFFEQVVLTEGRGVSHAFEPNVRKAFVRVPLPTLDDQRCDLARLTHALGGAVADDLAPVRGLPGVLRASPSGVTAVLEGRRVQAVEPGDTTDSLWGVAFDIGTTTIVGSMMDLTRPPAEGRGAIAARTNPQVHFGDDVVSRISFIGTHPDGLARVRGRLMACLNEMIGQMCGAAGAEPDDVLEVTVAGNTTMSHIFLGVDPSPIAHAPYVAVVRSAVNSDAGRLGLAVNPAANVHVLPNIAGFVGGDTVALIVACGMLHSDEVLLGVDIGTNGEVVLGNRGRLLACSCAAGPAFEGARIRHGMRAADGAISKVVVSDGIEVEVIGGGPAGGICGSGLIDAVAGLLDAGAIDETGRIRAPAECPAAMPDAVRQAVVEVDGSRAVVLVPAERSRSGEPILLTQRDVREVQLAKAAVQAGVRVLAREFGIEAERVPRVLLAGGFGNFIRRSCAKRIGLLPDVPSERIEFVGNTALAGAKAALVSAVARREAEEASLTTRYVELAGRADFQDEFADALTFPRRR